MSRRTYQLVSAVILIVFAVGLTRDLHEPWIGLHDWNGAFYSQLARNLRRYPFEVHHGMGVVAMGSAIPAPENRSIYATHPPGLVWLLAIVTAVGGEREAVARLLPIACSLGSLWLFMGIVRRRLGTRASLLAGAAYCVLPMTTYFGRMVNHEPVCLFLMLVIVAAWDRWSSGGAGARRWLAALWVLAAFWLIWTDWSGILFSVLFCVWLIFNRSRPNVSRTIIACVYTWTAFVTAVLMLCLVQYGFDGRWGDLWEVFLSRQQPVSSHASPGLWRITLENLGAAVIVLGSLGVIVMLRDTSDSLVRFARDPLFVLCATALLWVLVFLRQYRLHHYWLFYFAPIAALLVASSFEYLLVSASARGGRRIIAFAAFAWMAYCGVSGTAHFFHIVSCRAADIDAWKHLYAATAPDETVRLTFDPRIREQHGGYVFTNIAPAQLCFYLDRAFEVGQSVDVAPK